MAAASRPLGAGALSLGGMVSLDPTMGKSGYPLLLQAGESADGPHHVRRRHRRRDGRRVEGRTVAKLSLGYVRDVLSTGLVRWGIGGVAGLLQVPATLEP